MKAPLTRYPFRLPLVLILLQCLPLPLSLVSLVDAQTTHMVNVGLQGSFFDPPTISAGLGDIVTFVFDGLVHTVTQSTAQNPCLALPGGFSSGAAGKFSNDSTDPAPVWSLKVTNVSAPIWFFCEVTEPTSHCASGMVGVINPPSQAAYESVRSAAFAVTGTPVPSFTVALSGVGAFATQAPSIPATPISTPSDTPTSSLPSSTAPSSSSSSSSPPTSLPASSASATRSHLGAIIGGAVGGGALVVILLALFLWFYHVRRVRSSYPGSPATDDSRFFRYDPKPVPAPKMRPSQAFVAAKQLEGYKASGAASSASGTAPPSRDGLGGGNGNGAKNGAGDVIPRALSPNRSPYAPPGVPAVITTPAHPNQLPRLTGLGIDRQASFGTTTTTSNARVSEHASPISPSTINMHALASEVATLLRQPSANTLAPAPAPPLPPPNPEGPRPRPSNKHLEAARVNVSSVEGNGNTLSRGDSPHPPAYRPNDQGS